MKRPGISLLIAFCAHFSQIDAGQRTPEISVRTMPPVVVTTIPQAGATDVDPRIEEVRVRFSKDMMTDEMWSFVKLSDDTFPEIAGEVLYLEDERTCVLPVRLQAGRTYAVWINSDNHNAFRDRENRSAVPYLLVFETR